MISIIIINDLNSTKFLEETVLSIEQKIRNVELEIIIVNLKLKTEDDSRKKLRVYYLNTENTAKAKNFGASKASYEYLMFLKAGVVVSVNPFIHFFEKFKSRNYGAVGLKLFDYKNHFKINAWREIGLSEEVEEAAVNKRISQGNIQKALELENKYHDIASVYRVSSEAMVIKKSVFDEVEGFNEYLDIYYDDADLCIRLMNKKYVNYYYPFCKMIYLRLDEIQTPLYLKSRLRYYKIHNSFVTRFVLRISLIIKYLFLATSFNKEKLKSLKSVLMPY